MEKMLVEASVVREDSGLLIKKIVEEWRLSVRIAATLLVQRKRLRKNF
jgi:hypothetical protein